MAVRPNFTKTPRIGRALLSTANTNRDGTGTIVNIVDGATTVGSRIERITISATGTTTAGMIRFFYYDGVSNTDLKLEVSVGAITVSATIPAYRMELLDLGWILASGFSLRASTEKGESFRVIVELGDFDV
jgi:hypothetical protein